MFCDSHTQAKLKPKLLCCLPGCEQSPLLSGSAAGRRELVPSISLDAPQGSGDEVIHTLKLFHHPVLYLGDMGQPAEEEVMAELMNGTELVELCPVKVPVYRWRLK